MVIIIMMIVVLMVLELVMVRVLVPGFIQEYYEYHGDSDDFDDHANHKDYDAFDQVCGCLPCFSVQLLGHHLSHCIRRNYFLYCDHLVIIMVIMVIMVIKIIKIIIKHHLPNCIFNKITSFTVIIFLISNLHDL